MKQLMPVDRYIELIRNAGIEQAYQMRHRGTGRTKRLALRILADVSEGKTLFIKYGSGNDMPRYRGLKEGLLYMVRELANNFMLDIEWVHRESSTECKTSGGSFHIVNADAAGSNHWYMCKRPEATEIFDHDS